MRRFYRVSGALTCVFLIAALQLNTRGSESAKNALAVMIVVWLGATVVVGMVHTAFKITARVRRASWPQLVPARRSGDLVSRLCRETGFSLTGREADHYQVRLMDHRSPVFIEVRYSDRSPNAMFQAWFPVRFSLEKPPAGLFARVLLRNTSMTWSAWGMSIGQSCEACLYVSASIPQQAMDARVFNGVCQEIAQEIRGFREELQSKFSYDLGGVVLESMSRDGRSGVPLPAAMPQVVRGQFPVKRGDGVPDVWQVG
jgi:hypothetical protein